MNRKTPMKRTSLRKASFKWEDAPRVEKIRKPFPKRVPLPKSRPDRKAKLFAQQFLSSAFVAWMKQQPCAVCGERGPNECAHVARSRGAGGSWKDTAPLCRRCHTQEHTQGARTFWRVAGKNPIRVAAEYHERWNAYQEWAA